MAGHFVKRVPGEDAPPASHFASFPRSDYPPHPPPQKDLIKA